MESLIIFDLDGVLVDTREIHFEALNRALNEVDERYEITREEHLAKYDGLPTRQKLVLLSQDKGLPQSAHKLVWERKQEFTRGIIEAEMGPDRRIAGILLRLRQEGNRIFVASNCVRETVKMLLLRKGLMEHVDYFLSNEDVRLPKPSPEIYLRCIIEAGIAPGECLVVEDSQIGRKAALASGAHLCGVKNPDDLTYDRVRQSLDAMNQRNRRASSSQRWQDPRLNVLVPMAGAGRRFEQAGYSFPKPLIEINGKPMIQRVIENLAIDANYIFIVQREHYEQYNLRYLLNMVAPSCKVVKVDGVTEGAACTTLLAGQHIDAGAPLLIVNSDQMVDWDSSQFMYSMVADSIDGGIATFRSSHPKWSFARLDEHGFVSEVAEKRPISDHATVGIYYWKRGSDYVRYAKQMIEREIRTNNEFYICPVFNEAIEDGKRIKTFEVNRMWGLGTPEDLETYLRNGAVLDLP